MFNSANQTPINKKVYLWCPNPCRYLRMGCSNHWILYSFCLLHLVQTGKNKKRRFIPLSQFTSFITLWGEARCKKSVLDQKGS
jgi:hypothetical protein